ncbi:DeoR/GlpR family DNA-binding transcription regulator [Sphingobium sp. HBC34]|uniref:DeoR/GlpR family DNA-binding transcription regulator n=1 Tax=Sphingobium cyanobacteriorum TaxID=3063954 RepID=A0ABT8ZQ09_9SPHN|nr:DeoR/GlpR family DNA-binding transcription regulator [Sphingobium sp. HBC34]MDO7836624.1 DeoR/GlpR family DNA-binding transcription regulator [Sphingobium sp. HBC34]
MHASQRQALILQLLGERGFVSFRDLEVQISGSQATIRRDLERLAQQGKLVRLRGGITAIAQDMEAGPSPATLPPLAGVPFHENVSRNRQQKEAIGKAAANLCSPGEGVMIDGGSTTLQMCPHLAGLNLQVLTNSLHIVAALIGQQGTRILVPSGAVFPEQNIILSVFGDDGMPRFHAPKLFMGAASVGPQGLMQADVVLVAGERRFIERADTIIIMVDSTKFDGPSGNVVCALDEVDTIITDAGLSDATAQMLERAGVNLIVAG